MDFEKSCNHGFRLVAAKLIFKVSKLKDVELFDLTNLFKRNIADVFTTYSGIGWIQTLFPFIFKSLNFDYHYFHQNQSEINIIEGLR